MLNIPSKKELTEVVEKNKDQFLNTKKKAIQKALKRDKGILLTDIFPRFKQTIALTHYLHNHRYFHFDLPLMELEGYDLTEEEKEKIIHEYYLQEGIMILDKEEGIGKKCKFSLVRNVFKKELKIEVVFKTCEINQESNTVHFQMHLVEAMQKSSAIEEVENIADYIDECLLPHVNFEVITKKINRCYRLLQSETLFAVYSGDLDNYPIVSIDVEEILEKMDFRSHFHISDEKAKIEIREYVKRSKLLKALAPKLKEYGYKLNVAIDGSEDEWYRNTILEMGVSAYHTSKNKEEDVVVKSETLRDVFFKKKTEYDTVLQEKLERQNEVLVELVESGHFDEMIAVTWMKATLMSSSQKATEFGFRGRCAGDEVEFHFQMPFDRNIEGMEKFKRTYYIRDGVGSRYMRLPNNVLHALKKRYPFLKKAKYIKDTGCDYQRKEDTLTFVYEVNRTVYKENQKKIFEWIANSYGALDVASILELHDFYSGGISQKIEQYMKEQSTKERDTKEPIQIVLADVTSNEIWNVYKESELYTKTKAMFENEHGNEFGYSFRMEKEYKEAKMKEIQSFKLANLFAHALLTQKEYKEMKQELKKHGYDLKIEFVTTEQGTMKTGRVKIDGSTWYEEVYEYNIQLVVE